LAAALIRLGGDAALQSALLPKIASGETLLAFAHAERQSRYDLADVAMSARKDGSHFILDGEKTLVLGGDSAGQLVVSARLSGARPDKAGIGLFLVDATTEGIARRGYPSIDGRRAAEIAFTGVRVPASAAIGEPGDAFGLIERVTGHAVAALCAEAVGAMDALHANTVDYLKTRSNSACRSAISRCCSTAPPTC
jgi:alkylation response protein AidB-like acyl-CoA dehydrogenase